MARTQTAAEHAPVVRQLHGPGFEIRTRDKGRPITLDFSYAAIKAGVPATVVRDLQRMDLLESRDVHMIIPSRTLDRRTGKKEPLKPDEADGIARLLRVISHAMRVFEDDELAEEWLRCPNPALDDEVPMTMAATDVGAREVEGVLTRIEHGVFD